MAQTQQGLYEKVPFLISVSNLQIQAVTPFIAACTKPINRMLNKIKSIRADTWQETVFTFVRLTISQHNSSKMF